MHMYQDSNTVLPTGWVTTTALKPSPGFTWNLLILPYIEQGNLFNTINPDLTVTLAPVSAQQAGLQTSVKTYQCPADTYAILNTAFGSQAPINVNPSLAKANYVVNREVVGPDVNNNPTPMTIQGIRDGSSNTILVGERDMTINVGGIQFVRASTTASFEGRPGLGLSPQPAPGSVWNTGSDQRLAFSSMHSGGCNFVLADGSVHFISNNIPSAPSPATYSDYPANAGNYPLNNLIHPSDGNTVNYPF